MLKVVFVVEHAYIGEVLIQIWLESMNKCGGSYKANKCTY